MRTGAVAVSADPGPGKVATGPVTGRRPWGVYALRALFLLTLLGSVSAPGQVSGSDIEPVERVITAITRLGAAVCATLALVGWAVTVGPPGRR